LQEKSEEIIDHDTILVEAEYKVGRGTSNRSRSRSTGRMRENIFDGCAVLMRRLLEVMLNPRVP